MKTVVSIPDPVFDGAEKLAERPRGSRSELYTRAPHDHVDQHRDESITEALYASEPSATDVGLRRLQSLDRDDWGADERS
jgi:hypothetical protein